MPKGGRRAKKGANLNPVQTAKKGADVNCGNSLVGSDEADSVDVASMHSMNSSRFDLDYDEVNCNEEEPNPEEGYYDDFEDKLLQAIEAVSAKSAKVRTAALDTIRRAFSSRFAFDFIMERRMTISDILERCLKRGKGEEQGAAALLSTVVFINLGPGDETDLLFREIESLLNVIMSDSSALASNRSKCAIGLGLTCFIAGIAVESIDSIMDALYSTFGASFYKGNGAPPTHNPEITGLHCNALLAWTLLLTIRPACVVLGLAEKCMKRIAELLDSSDVELRIAAGETIAVLHEIARECDEDFIVDDMDSLCNKLRQLATDSQKFRGKKERKIQRSSFRDFLKAVEDRDAPSFSIKFGKERLEIDSWCRKRQYDAFCNVLGSGMNLHLTENELVRDIFGLGAPLGIENTNGQKVTKFERHMENIAACKARTKTRGKLRDKRADVIW